jgi:hypothetical protein
MSWWYDASFFLDYHTTKKNQLKITEAIKELFIGPGCHLTQERMEQYFHTDEYFVDAEAGFFKPKPITA